MTTGFVNKELWLWPDKITWLLGTASEVKSAFELGREQIHPTQIDDVSRPKLWGKIVPYLLSIPDPEKHEWISVFSESLELSLPQQAPKEFEACNWGELLEMQECGIGIGGHTHTHPSLGQVNSEQLSDELQTCFSLLSNELGSIDRDFCYPNGQPSDFNERVINATKGVGFCSSVTAFYDHLATQKLYEMRRHTASDDLFQFYKSVNGVEAFMAKYLGAHNRMDDSFC
ncbi:hypothetical protein A3715_28515 [Oleiphilus sp. HI0009]|nr:hypothetical protein A3715_28515 [Oleiphilus sp. HI0009]